MLVGFALLAALALAWCIPCHADAHNCAGECPHSQCCGGHAMPLLFEVNPAPIISDYFSSCHAAEEQPVPSVLVSSIFRPPQV